MQGYVGEPIAQIDHIGKGDAFAVVRHGVVECFVVGHVQHAFVDAVDELGFRGVVDSQLGPGGLTVLAVIKLAGEDLFKFRTNGAPSRISLSPEEMI